MCRISVHRILPPADQSTFTAAVPYIRQLFDGDFSSPAAILQKPITLGWLDLYVIMTQRFFAAWDLVQLRQVSLSFWSHILHRTDYLFSLFTLGLPIVSGDCFGLFSSSVSCERSLSCARSKLPTLVAHFFSVLLIAFFWCSAPPSLPNRTVPPTLPGEAHCARQPTAYEATIRKISENSVSLQLVCKPISESTAGVEST